MNIPKDNTPAEVPREQAAEWFINLQGSEVSRADQEAFADWLRRSPVHVEEFLRLTALQGDLARLPELKNLDVAQLLASLDADPNANVVDFKAEVSAAPRGESQKSPLPRSRPGPRVIWATGAAFALIAMGVVSIDPLRNFFGAEHYHTAIGEQRSLTLADGSHVQLNVKSSLTAKVNDVVRDVRLGDGEALFQVAKDAARPFRVHTPQATIEAKGTQFDVRVKDGATIVSLLEGRVAVTPSTGENRDGGAAGASVMLDPGQQLTVAMRAAEWPTARKVDLKTVTAWTEHRLVFEDTPLSDVIAEFNRYSRQPLLIQDSALLDKRITASFDSGSVQAFGESLAAASGLRVIQQPDGTWLIER
jgi:transmembrane sensor